MAAIATRVIPIEPPKSMKVRISAAGLSEGAASVMASGGPRREDLARMPENIGAAQHEQIANAERCRTEQIALQRKPVAVAAGELKNRLEALARQQGRGNRRRHVCAGARTISHVDRIGESAQRQRQAQNILRIAGNRRRHFCGHDESSRAQSFFEARDPCHIFIG